MIPISLAQLKNDITPMLKGTSLREVTDFYGICAKAANRMLLRISPIETRRTVTMATPFYDNVQDYPLVSDFKKMIDIRPQANRKSMPGQSNFLGTGPKQFDMKMDANSFSIKWNNMIRSLRAQRLPGGNVAVMDYFDSPTSNGSWSANLDASGLYTEPLNYVQGNGATGFNLSGATGNANLLNTTASVFDLSAYNYEDASMIYFWIPVGFSSRFTSINLLRGEDASNYISKTVTTKADGTAFSDGWNFLLFDWTTGTKVGSPTNLKNIYRKISIVYTAGPAINGCLIDSWTNAFGQLYEIEYYSEYLFRSAAGVWKAIPDSDTDLVNVTPSSYEILKTEMMIDITQIIRIGNQRASELADWRMMLNGQPPSRYIRDPQYRGLYNDYILNFPESSILTRTQYYDFDI